VKVLSFSYCFPSSVAPSWGVFVLQRVRALARLVDLEVASPVSVFPLWSRLQGSLPPRREQQSGLTVHHPRFFYVPKLLKSRDGWFYGRGLRRWMRRYCDRRRPDLLDAHFVWPDGVGVADLARRMGIPYTITLRGKIYPCLESRSMREQCAEALRRAAAVISVSGPMADEAVALGVDPGKIYVIPNGVDTERFRPQDKAEARRRLDLPEDVKLLVLVGHLKPTKGHGELVRALAKLPEDVHAVLVGGQVERINYRDRLGALIDELGLAGRVRLDGPQPYERIPTYLAAADVGVLASHREGCPNVVLEALASGRPVVATDVGAVPDILGPDAGRIVPAKDPDAMAAALSEVLAQTWSPEDLSRSGCVKSWDTVAREVQAVFAGVLGD